MIKFFSLKVDELETGEFNDANFWKFTNDVDHLSKCLNDLDV